MFYLHIRNVKPVECKISSPLASRQRNLINRKSRYQYYVVHALNSNICIPGVTMTEIQAMTRTQEPVNHVSQT